MLLVGRLVGLLDHYVRLREALLDVPLPYQAREGDVPAFMDVQGALLQGLVYCQVRGQRIVIDLHGVHTLDRGVFVLGADQCYGIPHKVDLLLVQQGLIGDGVPDLVLTRHVGSRQNGLDALDLEGRLRVYAPDEGVWLAAPHDLHDDRALRDVVSREACSAEALVEGVSPDNAPTHDEIVVSTQQVAEDLVILHGSPTSYHIIR